MGNTYKVAMMAYTDHQSKNLDWIGYSYRFTVNDVFDPVAVPEISLPAFASSDVYSISGVLVRKNATTLEGLPKGIYIVNGKKVVY